MRRLIVTGATGFLGRAVADEARKTGAAVQTTSRSGGDVALDLTGPDAQAALVRLLCEGGPATVIHLAGLMSGSDEEHAAATVGPTGTLLAAIEAAQSKKDGLPDLVLASSLSVYGYAPLPDGATLDELTPLETKPASRDAYARAKLAQERAVLQAAQHKDLAARVLRPGSIIGEDHAWTARIGIDAKGTALVLGGDAALPLVDVTACAKAFVLAATRPLGRCDVTIAPDTDGHFEAINVVGAEQPSQSAYLAAMPDGPRGVRIPWRLLSKGSEAAGLAAELMPRLGDRLPGLAKPETLAARAKPLVFSAARAEDRLGWRADPTKATA